MFNKITLSVSSERALQNDLNLVAGPPRWPIVGTLPYQPGQLIHLYAHKHWLPKYGPLVGLCAGPRTVVVVCGGEEAMAVLNHEHCQARPDGFSFKERSFGRQLGKPRVSKQ